MINLKKIRYIVFLLFVWLSFHANADFTYENYENNVKDICLKDYEETKVSYEVIKYKKAEDYTWDIKNILLMSNSPEVPIKSAVANYKWNMNNIYKCAIINVQINTINTIEKLLKSDKNWDILKSVEPKLTASRTNLLRISDTTKCKDIDKTEMFSKLAILRQTTYETCRFNYYMEYLKWYYSDLKNVLKIDDKSDPSKVYVSTDVVKMQGNIVNRIDMEISQAYKIFPVAYNAYSEYENNYPIHFMYVLLKYDFSVYRKKLYQALQPINQVVYKISGAMSSK